MDITSTLTECQYYRHNLPNNSGGMGELETPIYDGVKLERRGKFV